MSIRVTYGKALWHKTMRPLLVMCGLPVFLTIDKEPNVLAQLEEAIQFSDI